MNRVFIGVDPIDSVDQWGKEFPMYRLMMSEKLNRNAMTRGTKSSYRQTEVVRISALSSALNACELANLNSNSRFYVLDELGREYYGDIWID